VEPIEDNLAKVGALLLEERVLRRVIRRHRQLPGLGLAVPHEVCYTLPRADLIGLADRRELGVDPATLPARVTVLHGERTPLAAGNPAAWTQVWRAVYHAKIDEHLGLMLADGRLTEAQIRERIARIGQTEFDEIRLVLRQAELTVPPYDDAQAYVEFAALYLELAAFAPRAVPRTFPILRDRARIDAILAGDVDAAALLAAARPGPAPAVPCADSGELDASASRRSMPAASPISDPLARGAAKGARERGNLARAAILAARAGDVDAALVDLEGITSRLGAALGGVSTEGWAAALLPVARGAGTQGSVRYSVGARLLLDLQAAYMVAEREVKIVDVMGWAASLGRTAVVRGLPATREVRIAKHVRAAVARLPTCRVPIEDDRGPLADALHAVVEHADHAVRHALRPAIEAALDEVGLVPHHLPERVARHKLVDELLDVAVATGHLSIGNLRDALSHNELKLPDLTLRALAGGDQLLRADRALAARLDGVYRRGEIYLRGLQKLSSILFGTAVGRVVCLYFLLPLLGAFTMLEGLQHVVGPLCHKAFHVEPEIATPEAFAGVGMFLFLLLHAPLFRTGTWWLAKRLGRGLQTVVVRIPRWILHREVIQRVLRTRLARWVLVPAIPATPVALVVGLLAGWPQAVAVFVVEIALANTRPGRVAEEIAADWAVRSGRQVARHLLPGLFKLILDFFIRLIDLLDRGIYTVDEWLRFKSGQSRVTLIVKGVLGTAWFAVAYFLRLYVNLFVEPVINPIKHFPVVTVAAKLTIPFTQPMLAAINDPLAPIVGSAMAKSIAGITVFVIPGLAGFLVWEFKENWKLYAASRPEGMGAVAFGHHGETMVAMLRPGFHSGTIPRVYGKIRRASWKGDEHAVAKQREALHHVEEAIAIFVERELIALLAGVPALGAVGLAIAHVELGSNRVELELACPGLGEAPAVISIEEQSGYLVASLAQPGWIGGLTGRRREIVELALAGFYKLAAIDLVREQLEHALIGPDGAVPPYDIAAEGLIVWPAGSYESEIVYDLRSSRLPVKVRGPAAGVPPVLGGSRAVFGREPLPWDGWDVAWAAIEQDGEVPHLTVGPSLLPAIAVEPGHEPRASAVRAVPDHQADR
jgi:hypothetical protein